MENIYKDSAKTEKVRQIINDMKGSQNSAAELGKAVQDLVKAATYIALAGLLIWAGLEASASAFSTPKVSYIETVGMIAALRAFSLVLIEPLLVKKK